MIENVAASSWTATAASISGTIAAIGALAAVAVFVKLAGQRQQHDAEAVERLQESLDRPDIPDDVAPTLSSSTDRDDRAVLPALDWTTDIAQRRAKVYVEHHQASLRQQGVAFWSSLAVGSISLILIIVGVGFALFAATEVGVLTSVSSLLPGAASALLFSQSKAAGIRADENLKLLTASVDRAEAVQMSIRIAANVRHEPTRDRLIAIASLVAAFPNVAAHELSTIAAGNEAE